MSKEHPFSQTDSGPSDEMMRWLGLVFSAEESMCQEVDQGGSAMGSSEAASLQSGTKTQAKRSAFKSFHVRLFGKWCKGCGLCIAFCPRQVFTEDENNHPVVSHPERCTGCQWCVIHCPDFAIIVEPVDDGEDEVAK